MANEMTTLQVAVHAQCEIYRDHARAQDAPQKLTRDEMRALTQLRNERAEESGVSLTTVIAVAQKYMHQHEPKVMKRLMQIAGLVDKAGARPVHPLAH